MRVSSIPGFTGTVTDSRPESPTVTPSNRTSIPSNGKSLCLWQIGRPDEVGVCVGQSDKFGMRQPLKSGINQENQTDSPRPGEKEKRQRHPQTLMPLHACFSSMKSAVANTFYPCSSRPGTSWQWNSGATLSDGKSHETIKKR